MVDIFISYSRRDQEMVALLAHAIEAEGYDVWWDAELPPHQSYGDVITAKIAMAKAALVVWSDDAVKSEWVRAEADMARNQRKLIQTALNNVMPPLPFNQIQYAEMGGWHGEPDHPGWRKVKMSLVELCGSREPIGPEEGQEKPFRPVPPPLPPQPEPREDVQPQSQPQPAQAAAKWPLFAGIGIGAVALAAAGGLLLGQRGPAPAAPSPAPAVSAPAASAAAPPAETAAVPAAADAAPVDDDGVPIEPNPADMTFADSSTRLIAPSEIASRGPSTLKVARNEIFARKGRRFKDPWLRDWFSRYAWYRPRYDEVPLNPIEQRNVALIRQAEARFGG
jgi:hypothetical protein